MLEVGKLYLCEEFFLLLYPDQEACATASSTAAAFAAGFGVAAGAAYWARILGKSVSYTEKKIPLLVLNNKKEYIEVLAGDKKGWIIVKDWLGIKEIK